MKLVRLILENIKSYSYETIDFYDGVNFISGINGAGKTTIIEAIGYALFDSNPFSSQKQFIRKGEKSGTITVVVEAADERLYRIVRKLREPAGGSWAIYDEDSGMELNELHGNQDVKAWLAVNLGVGEGLDSVRLFEDVIGISQGKFISPFLERPKERKKIFNTILQLESYREAFDKSSSLVSKLKDRINEKEGEKKTLLVKVVDIEECRKKLKENQDKYILLEKKQKKLAIEISSLQEAIQLQEGYRTELEKNQHELHRLGVHLAAIISRKDSLQTQAHAAELNKKKALLAEAGYKEYESQKQINEILEEKRKARETINVKMQELKNQIISLQVEINSGKQTLKRQIQQLQTDKKDIVQEGETLSTQRDRLAIKQKDIKAWQLKFTEHKGQCGSVQRAHNIAQQYHAVLSAREDNYKQLMIEKESLIEALKLWTEKEKSAAEILTLEHKLDKVREELNKNKARLITLQDNSKAAGSGLCPFVETQCLSIEGNLQDHFKKEIENLTLLTEDLGHEETSIIQSLSLAKLALEDFYMLQHQKKQLEKLLEQEKGLVDLLNMERDTMATGMHPSQIVPLYHVLSDSEEYFKQTAIKKDNELNIIAKKIHELIDQYQALYPDLLTKQGVILPVLRDIKSLCEDFSTRMENIITANLQDINNTLTVCETKLDALRERYRKVNQQLTEITADKTLEEKEKELKLKEQEMFMITEELKNYLSLDADYKKSQDMLARYEPDYIQYMQNFEGIQKYEALSFEIQEVIQDENRYMQKEVALKEELLNLQMQYKPDLLVDLRNRIETKIMEKGGAETDLGHTAKEVEDYTRQVREKEIVSAEIVSLEKEIASENKAQELLRLIRQTFNQSPEEIAELYRQHLGREANYIYQQIAKENVTLIWGEDFELKILENQDKKDGGRTFAQLSGGEKMTAALAVRLALLKQLSGLGMGIFDEPTANLDENRRSNLARIIPQVTRDFRQLFVISHDDTFDAITENVIQLRKDASGTKVVK